MAKKREEVDAKDKWNVEAMYPTLDAFEKEFNEFLANNKGFKKLLAFQGKLGDGEDTMLKFLIEYNETLRVVEKLYTYAHLRFDENLANEHTKKLNGMADQLFHNITTHTAWVQPEILHLDQAVVDKYLKSDTLKEYRFYLEQISVLKPHTLSSQEEQLLALSGQALSATSRAYSSFANADLRFEDAVNEKGEKKEVTTGSYGVYQQSRDRTLRKSSCESLFKGYISHENMLTDLLGGCVQAHLFEARARKYPSCVDAALFPNQIDTGVYHNLIKTLRENINPVHEYMELHKELLGVDTLELYDMNAPVGHEYDMKVSFDEAIELCIVSAAPLGQKYQDDLRKGLLEERWSDRYENEGKRSGAYSSGCYDSPPYILMNYEGTHSDLSTLMHEAGHSMHTHYSKTQPYHYSNYSIFVAEVASTFNEELLFNYMLERAQSKEEKSYLISRQINNIRSTLVRQTLFAEFELRIHEMAEKEIPITKGQLCDLYANLNKDYYGKALNINKEFPYEFFRIPHFYLNFYVYQYATGLSAAHALVKNVCEKGMLDEYLGFLSSGSSDYPLNVLKKAGVDMLSAQPIKDTLDYFGELTKQLKSCQ